MDNLVRIWCYICIIEPSDSPWSSPLVIVTKKSGDIRVCVDYHAINSVMRKSAIPLPRIQECLESLSGSKYFCTMDLAQGYYQVAMHPDFFFFFFFFFYEIFRVYKLIFSNKYKYQYNFSQNIKIIKKLTE